MLSMNGPSSTIDNEIFSRIQAADFTRHQAVLLHPIQLVFKKIKYIDTSIELVKISNELVLHKC